MKKVILLIATSLLVLVSCSERLEERILTTHPNKTPALVEYHKKGEENFEPVKIVRFYINGEKKEETFMKDGKRHGLHTKWYVNGEKMQEVEYSEGQYNGAFTQWYDNGKKDYEAQYNMGSPSGVWKFYDKNGSLLSQTSYE